jgi:hypothetical protein
MNASGWLTHGVFIAAAFGACALLMALELWWLRRDTAHAVDEAIAAGAAGVSPVRSAVLVQRTPTTSTERAQGDRA